MFVLSCQQSTPIPPPVLGLLLRGVYYHLVTVKSGIGVERAP